VTFVIAENSAAFDTLLEAAKQAIERLAGPCGYFHSLTYFPSRAQVETWVYSCMESLH
jgi:hypothetical protein